MSDVKPSAEELVYKAVHLLEGEALKCPSCGSTSSISRNESVLINTPVLINEDGTWDWDGDREADIHWDTSDYRKESGEREWRCKNCDNDFDAPNARNTNVPRKGKLVTSIKIKNENGEEEELEIWRLPDGGIVGIDSTFLDQKDDVIKSPYSGELCSLPEEEEKQNEEETNKAKARSRQKPQR